jgi:AAA+ ATPase superfamily predicted ATPase
LVMQKYSPKWGYNNVLIKAKDQWKAAFKCSEGLFEPVVMFYGLTNAPLTFQVFMEWVFTNFLNEGWLKIFINNMLIKSLLMWEHKEREIKVLARLAEHDLFLKPEKCEFSQRQVEYLGFLISKGSVHMDPKKLRGITDWEIPRTVTEVRSFLGFGNFLLSGTYVLSLCSHLRILYPKPLILGWIEST